MATFNKTILIGNLCATPELRQTANGVAVTSFRIAVPQNYKNEDEDKPQADFIDIVCWKHNAEYVTRYFTKGDGIFVCGSLHTRKFVDSNNVTQYRTEVVAEQIEYYGHWKGKTDDEKNDNGSQESNT